jgi:hypothetical protein
MGYALDVESAQNLYQFIGSGKKRTRKQEERNIKKEVKLTQKHFEQVQPFPSCH